MMPSKFIFNFSKYELQSNLSTADILYSRHLVIADRFFRNWPNLGKTIIAKNPLYGGHFYFGYSL